MVRYPDPKTPLEGVNTAGCKHWRVTWKEDGKAHSATRKGYGAAARFAKNLPATATDIAIEEVPGGCC